MRLRRMPDGCLVAPTRGNPLTIPVPNGYIRSTSNLFKFTPIVKDCKHRVIGNEKLGCGKLIGTTYCRGVKIKISQCKNCSIRATT